jgi:hypothetical protein
MSDTSRYIGPRRPPLSAPRAGIESGALVTSPARLETLRQLVASGRYQVSPRFLATKIFGAAGLKIPE